MRCLSCCARRIPHIIDKKDIPKYVPQISRGRLIFVNNTKLNENRYTIGSGVGGKSSFVRSALCKRAQWKKDSTNNG